jgi:hypothetical protein
VVIRNRAVDKIIIGVKNEAVEDIQKALTLVLTPRQDRAIGRALNTLKRHAVKFGLF